MIWAVGLHGMCRTHTVVLVSSSCTWFDAEVVSVACLLLLSPEAAASAQVQAATHIMV